MGVKLVVGKKFYQNRFIRRLLFIPKVVLIFLIRKTFQKTSDGMKMNLDRVDSLQLSLNGVYEPFETELVKKKIKSGNIVVDLGANIGYYTLIFSKLVGDSGLVLAFEPDPQNFSILKRNVEANKCSNIVLFQKAVFNKNEILKNFLSDDNYGDHRIYNPGDRDKYKEVSAVVLDEELRDYNQIDFIKIDVQGSEQFALNGARQILSKNREIKIFMEFWPNGIRGAGGNPEELVQYLSSLGFKFEVINEVTHKIDDISMPQLLEMAMSKREPNGANLYIKR